MSASRCFDEIEFFDMPLLGFVGFSISLVLGVFTVLRYFIDF
jgi:hypothetical protein